MSDISNAAGDTLANLNGPGAVGMHNVNWDFQQTAPSRAAAELSPSQRRDSILLRARAPQVFDSLQKAGFDTTAIAAVRRQVGGLVNRPAGGAGVGGRGGDGVGRRRGGGSQDCAHPTTQWETFCARPAESVGGRGGGGGGGGFAGLHSASAVVGAQPPGGRSGRGGGRGAVPRVRRSIRLATSGR